MGESFLSFTIDLGAQIGLLTIDLQIKTRISDYQIVSKEGGEFVSKTRYDNCLMNKK
jgi:hypothetical protein